MSFYLPSQMNFPVLTEGQQNGLRTQWQSPHINEWAVLLQSIRQSHFTRYFKSVLDTHLSHILLPLLQSPLPRRQFGTSITSQSYSPAVNDLPTHFTMTRYISISLHMKDRILAGLRLSTPAHHGTISCMLTTRGFSTLHCP